MSSGEWIGTVKWFDADKGYGFIAPDGGGEDVFLHFSALQMPGYKTIDADTRVRFKVVQGQKGPQAAEVSELESVR